MEPLTILIILACIVLAIIILYWVLIGLVAIGTLLWTFVVDPIDAWWWEKQRKKKLKASQRASR